jgi:acetyl-CoA carboxylase carboxyl transferase subunit beta
VLAGEKLALAFELALSRRLPLIAVAAGGGVRTQDGMLAVLQMAKVATLAARLHRSGVPIISVLTHPTTGGVYAGLANQADIILAEPGGVASGSPAAGQGVGNLLPTVEQLYGAGMIDEIVERIALRDRLSTVLHLLCARGSLHLPLAELPQLGPVSPAWEMMRIGRHEERPSGATIAQRLMSTVQLLHGDRIGRDDPGMVAGIGRFEGLTVAFIAHQRRPDGVTETRLSPSAYRKAARIMQLAGRLELPLLSFVDTPGAESGVEAELHGISMAIAQNLALMGHLPAPVIAVITGEAGGAGSLANSLGDRILVTEHGLFTLPMVEGAITHPYFLRVQGGLRTDRSNLLLSLNARDAHALGVIDRVIPEPEGGAHLDAEGAIALIRVAVAESLGEVIASGPRKLADDRLRRARALGLAAPDGDDTARRELRELQSIQHSISRSIDDFRQDMRDRFEHRRQALPHLTTRLPKRPDLNELANRFNHLKETVSTAASQARHDLVDERRVSGQPPEEDE